MTDETTELLIRARAFIERGWCQYYPAVDDRGCFVDPKSERAVAWCALGALAAAGVPRGRVGEFWENPAIGRLKAAMGHKEIADFNNRQETVEPVLAAFDRAIAAADSR